MAVQQVFGGRVVWHCENDPAASKVLAHHWPMAHNLNDITKNDFEDIAPTIDVLCCGWPCQPFSLAGKRKGIDDERALWPYVARAIRALRPRYVVLENVAAVLRSPEFDRVANSLAACGYEFTWTCLRASDVGAPHRRERLFIVATDTDSGRWGTTEPHLLSGQSDPSRGGAADTARDGRPRLNGGPSGAPTRDGWEWVAARGTGRTPVADASGDGRDEGWPEPARLVRGSDAALSGDGPVELLPTPVAHDGKGSGPSGYTRNTPDLQCIDFYLPTPAASDGARGQDFARANRDGSGGDDLVTLAVKATNANQWGKYAGAIARWEQIAGPAPSPTEPNSRGNPRLAPAFSEWMLGWPAGHVTAVPGISRNDQLRIIGNGVVPQQAEAAIRYLLSIAQAAA